MFVTMVLAALVVDGLFSLLGLSPATAPDARDVFGSIELDYKFVAERARDGVFAALFWLTARAA